jgi:hypothetical protein
VVYKNLKSSIHLETKTGYRNVFFVLMGQSNMNGTGIISADDDGNHRILSFTKENRIIEAEAPLPTNTGTSDNGIGFGLSFGRSYTANNANDNCILVLSATGATGFGQGNWNSGEQQFIDSVDAYERAMDTITAPVFGGFLWHQGESDSTAAWSGNYATALSDFVSDLRTATGEATAPFIVGTLADDFINGTDVTWPNANRNEVNNAIIDAPNQISNCGLVDLSGLSSYDGIHFSSASYRTGGGKYYDAFALF